MGMTKQFPPYPEVADLPAGLSVRERHEFAFRLLVEQGDKVGDYIFAAIRQAPDIVTMERWAEMAKLTQQIYGKTIMMTYRACDRIISERATPIGKRH